MGCAKRSSWVPLGKHLSATGSTETTITLSFGSVLFLPEHASLRDDSDRTFRPGRRAGVFLWDLGSPCALPGSVGA